ncbi:MAG: hypothetical protein ACK54C_02085 [Betaproteobacteria bacterium]
MQQQLKVPPQLTVTLAPDAWNLAEQLITNAPMNQVEGLVNTIRGQLHQQVVAFNAPPAAPDAPVAPKE